MMMLLVLPGCFETILQLIFAMIATKDMGTVSHTTGLVAIYNHEFSGVNNNDTLLLFFDLFDNVDETPYFSRKVSDISQARFAFCRLVDPGMATSHVPCIVFVVVLVVVDVIPSLL